jgi:hypothetical protein
MVMQSSERKLRLMEESVDKLLETIKSSRDNLDKLLAQQQGGRTQQQTSPDPVQNILQIVDSHRTNLSLQSRIFKIASKRILKKRTEVSYQRSTFDV